MSAWNDLLRILLTIFVAGILLIGGPLVFSTIQRNYTTQKAVERSHHGQPSPLAH